MKLYKTLVRPLLDYASAVWLPHLVRNKVKLEKVQTETMQIDVSRKPKEKVRSVRNTLDNERYHGH